MRIYLDTCCLQRPSDDQTQPRIKIETEAVLVLLAAAEAGDFVLLSSEAVEYELDRIENFQRRIDARALVSLAAERLLLTESAELHAMQLETNGFGAMDAVHIAIASEAGADYFCTCDDQLLRRARDVRTLNCKVISLLSLVQEVIP